MSTLSSLLVKKNHVLISSELRQDVQDIYNKFDAKLNFILSNHNVKLVFSSLVSTSKYGTCSYIYSTKQVTITIYSSCRSIAQINETLAHEIVHAIAYINGDYKHGHDQWFWFTYGQLSTLLFDAKISKYSPQHNILQSVNENITK